MDEIEYHQLKVAVGQVSDGVFSNLQHYAAMVRKWQTRINLVAPATLGTLWQRHIIDSAQLFPLAGTVTNWVDFGSGGGFPGLVIAILMKEAGHGTVTLVESNGKKAAFLRQVAVELQLPATIINERLEASHDVLPLPGVISARALAPLPKLLEMITPCFASHTRALLQKGRDNAVEIEQARACWDFSLVRHASTVDDNSVILEITALHRRVR